MIPGICESARPGFNDQAAATATIAPTDFKLLWQALGTATIQFDNFTVIAIPEPSTWLAGALALGAIGFMQRRRLCNMLKR